MCVKGPFLFAVFAFGPEQYMIVAADPFLFGVHPKTVLRDHMIDLAQFGGVQSIEYMMQI